MGNIFSIQCGDALAGRCWDCIAKKSRYISQLEDNLVALEATRDRLSELRNDVIRTTIVQQRPHMEQSRQVAGWVSRVDETVAQVTGLLTKGAQERRNFCMACYCSNNCVSTYKLGKSVARSLVRVNALIAEADFNQVVVNAPARQLESDLRELRNAKAALQARKQDLQQRISSEEGPEKRTLEEANVWLSKTETILAEADKLLEDGPLELDKLHGGDISNFLFVGRVAQQIEDIRSLHSRGDFNQVTAKALPRQVVERNLKPTVGTEEMLEEAWNLLHKVEADIIGIYGIGGVGKTTLPTQINNKFAAGVLKDFDVVIWVVVSRDLKLDNIQNSIWKQIQSSDEDWLKKSFEEKAQDIFNVLRGKRFVLLLDDMWLPFDLQEIGVPHPTKQNGCKVVLTTRSFSVCKQMEATKTMKVKPLNREEAWKLFKEKVGKIDADFSHVAQKVAEECRSLPIALITIGRAMASRSTLEEWEHALKVMRRSVSNLQGMEHELYQGMEVHVFKRLKFSYDCLPNITLQSCFLYCSLFPEDFKILKDDLVHYWITEKFCTRSEGYDIIYTLLRQCLLEEEGECVKLHDVIRDMAIWIACKYEKEKHMFFIQAGVQLARLPGVEEWEGAKKVSFMGNSLTSIERSPRCYDLVTLFLGHNKKLNIISEGFFKFMARLTVLDLSHTKIKVLPAEIMNLHSLEYLNLSYTHLERLPVEIRSLVRLKYLNLDNNVLLKMIPVEVISSLSKLQVLNMFQCDAVYFDKVVNNVLSDDGNKLVKELASLKNLSELSLEVRSASFLHSICRNQQLSNSIRALRLHYLHGTKSLDISSLANAKKLHLLDISLNYDVEELVIEERRAQVPGSSLDNNFPIFYDLRVVVVGGNQSMRHMTWLVFAPHLTILRARDNYNMEEIISVEKLSEHLAWGEHSNIFAKLQVLELYKLPKLKTISREALSFPCLTEINVWGCSAIKKLPFHSKSADVCNVMIKGEESWWNELIWDDDQTRAAFSSCFRKI